MQVLAKNMAAKKNTLRSINLKLHYCIVLILCRRGAGAVGAAAVIVPVAQIVRGQYGGKRLPPYCTSRTALQNTRAIVFLSNLARILTKNS